MNFGTDLPIILRWWATLAVVGWVGWPLTKKIFPSWENGGYLLAKAVGILGVSLTVFIMGSLGVTPLTWPVILGGAALVVAAGRMGKGEKKKIDWKKLAVEEIVFGGLLLAWTWVKAHEPSINGLEKFMDFGFTQSILRSQRFPPVDMWFSGLPINYYYFGHLMMAVLTKISGISLAYTFNLMLATLFALCASMSFTIGRQLLQKMSRAWKLAGAVLVAFLVSLAGNLQTIYAFTKGYAGQEDNPQPFWQIMINPLDPVQRKTGRDTYWYPNATRFIPWTIHEFPGYSFVVSDIHGHVLSIPLALLLLAMLVNMFGRDREKPRWKEYAAYGMTAGAAFMTNALDGPIYMGLLGLLLAIQKFKIKNTKLKTIARELIKTFGLAVVVFGLTVLPFVQRFKPFVNGVAVNCPPQGLAGKTFGPLIFEEVEKCQKSPLWMMLILWGLFLYCGLGLWHMKNGDDKARNMLLVWAVFSLGLIIFPEFFYFKDIYPQHFRSNTMFKLGYQVFMMMSILAGYTITQALVRAKSYKWWVLGAAPLLYLAAIYPTFSVKSYFGELTQERYLGVYGLEWLKQKYPGDAAAIDWLNQNVTGQPVVLEANGDSYTDYDRISTFTGLPTVAGWTVHEWLWRGGYTPIADRAEEVRQVYEAVDPTAAREILQKYQVKYVIVGDLERQKYPNLNEEVIEDLGPQVFSAEGTVVYGVAI